METSTIRIAIRDLKAPWNARRVPDILDDIAASLREEADVPARRTADSMTIAIAVVTHKLPDVAAFLRDRDLI